MLAGQETEALHTVRLFVFGSVGRNQITGIHQCVYTALKAKFFFIDSIDVLVSFLKPNIGQYVHLNWKVGKFVNIG